jgi:alpha-mannosidase
MFGRYGQLDRTLEMVEREALGVGGALVNTLPYRRVRLVGDRLVELDGFEGRRVAESSSAEEVLRVEVAGDGTLSVTDLRTGRRFDGLHLIEDEPDAGDLYTFCPGGPVRRAALAGVEVVRDDDLVRELLVEYEFPAIRIQTIVRVVRGLDRVELQTTVESQAGDHRLRVRFPVRTDAREVRAESQFAVVRRPPVPPPPRAEWVEPPAPTAHTLGSLALGPLAVLTKGLPEYEADSHGLALTLLRCVGTISRPNGLATRPLAAGPDLATPDGQCLGTHVLEYALRFDADRLSDATLIRAGQDYRNDFLLGDPFQPPLTLDGDIVFSCLKGAEDGDRVVLRVFNPNATPERLDVGGVRAERIRLDETTGASGGLELAPGEVATFNLRR